MERKTNLVAEPGDRVEVDTGEGWLPGELISVSPETERYNATYEVKADNGEEWVSIADGIRKPA